MLIINIRNKEKNPWPASVAFFWLKNKTGGKVTVDLQAESTETRSVMCFEWLADILEVLTSLDVLPHVHRLWTQTEETCWTKQGTRKLSLRPVDITVVKECPEPMTCMPEYVCLCAHRVLAHLHYQLFNSVQSGVGPRRGILPVAIQVKAHQRAPADTQCDFQWKNKLAWRFISYRADTTVQL